MALGRHITYHLGETLVNRNEARGRKSAMRENARQQETKSPATAPSLNLGQSRHVVAVLTFPEKRPLNTFSH